MNLFIDIEYPSAAHQDIMDSLQDSSSLNLKQISDQTSAVDSTKLKVKKNEKYHWGVMEEKKYVNFLFEKRKLFKLSVDQKRRRGVHVQMSKYIKLRSPTQCRTHHQKMLLKYHTVENIIQENIHLLKPSNLKKIQDKEQIQINTPLEQVISQQKIYDVPVAPIQESFHFDDLQSFSGFHLNTENYQGESLINYDMY